MAAATLSTPAIMSQNINRFSSPTPTNASAPPRTSSSARSASTESAGSPDPDRAPSLSGSPSPSSSSSCGSPPLGPPLNMSLPPPPPTSTAHCHLDTSDSTLGLFKIEEMSDEDTDMKNIPTLSPLDGTSSGASTIQGTVSDVRIKRGRGRPRKHPLPVAGTVAKVTKGRSKTGCITCRRRKKKCDEMRPECNNCVKNSVVCEGYPRREIWQSGKQKSENNSLVRRGSDSTVGRVLELPNLIDGVETAEDRFLFDHFIRKVSRVLTVFNDDTNPFQEHLVPLAIQHRGLMHSLLCLSGSHMAVKEPKYQTQQAQHFVKAIQFLREDVKTSTSLIPAGPTASSASPPLTPQSSISTASSTTIGGPSSSSTAITTSAGGKTIAQILLLCLNSICLGEKHGEYRIHMDAARLMLDQIRDESPLHRFLYEFFMFHDVINCLTTLDRRPIQYINESLHLPSFFVQPQNSAMLGVLDGLFTYISRITVLRDTIRERRQNGLYAVDYKTLSEAVKIDGELQAWQPPHNCDSHPARFYASLLYRQCTWIYLYRTILESRRGSKIDSAVADGLRYLSLLPENSGTDSVLLMPLFILGCAAFDPDVRPRIEERFEGIQGYSGLRNVEVARDVVRRVWKLMDEGEEARSWDWERIIKDMDYDFLVT